MFVRASASLVVANVGISQLIPADIGYCYVSSRQGKKRGGKESSKLQRNSKSQVPIEVAPKAWTQSVSFEATVMKHLKSQKRHSKAYRKQAVELLLTGRTVPELAAELNVGASTLQRWKEEYLADLAALPTDTTDLPPHQMWAELQRLRKENQKLKLHQEILKKAMGILSDLPPGGMP
jgi:transposase